MLLKKSHLVLCIVNQVTINQCANVILASGAKPVMSNDLSDAQELLKMAKAVYLNTGTINSQQQQIMLQIAQEARVQQIPLLLDPVGAGASLIRTQSAQNIITSQPSIIRGNAAEIRALVNKNARTIGVDAKQTDHEQKWADHLHKITRATVLMTGIRDYIVANDGQKTVSGGSSNMELLTGTGCMLSALTAALLTELNSFQAAIKAAAIFKQMASDLFSQKLPSYPEIYSYVHQAI